MRKKLAIITLTNRNSESPYQKVAINLVTGGCKLAEDVHVERNQLIDLGIQHPLITQHVIKVSSQIFHYEYDDIDDLFHTARYVYSTLLSADNPALCKFKINPSAIFEYEIGAESIYFSIYNNRAAQDQISIRQLETIVSHLNRHHFEFLEGIMIDEEFTLDDLPQSIDGDMLYEEEDKLVELIKTPCDLKRYEIRYIGPDMGFGLFTRATIKKEDAIFFYGGVKKKQDDVDLRYAFAHRLDCLNMYLDAREFGNLSRFVNHAPDPDKNGINKPLLEANLMTTSCYVNGIEVVVFTANRDIREGEQLLVDYGKKFFTSSPMSRFKMNDNVTLGNILRLASKARLKEIRIMASDGVDEAKRYLLVRLCIIAGLIALLMCILELVV